MWLWQPVEAAELLVSEAKGGSGKFSNLSKGMQVVDQEAWEEEQLIVVVGLFDEPFG